MRRFRVNGGGAADAVEEEPTLYRCGRCGRTLSENTIEDHAWNAHVTDPVNIDFEPIITGGEA